MERSLRHLVLVFLVPSAALACLVGLGIGLWVFLGGAGTAELLLRGTISLVVVCGLALVAGLVLAMLAGRPLAQIDQAMADLRAGRVPPTSSSTGPAELLGLVQGLHDLGTSLHEQSRRGAKDQAQRARDLRTEALGRFADGIAREVQKSLAGLVGFAEMALRQEGVSGQLKNYLTLIDQEARSGREALERVLRYARQEDFPTEPLDVNQLLVDTSRGLVSPAEREQIRLKMNLAEDLPRVLGDAGLLMQVFTTLMANAREAMLPDGGVIELSTNTESSGMLVVMVKDSGRGIPVQLQERVFTPFFTSKGNRKGAGLDLAIAENIVRRHAGRIDFYSTPDEGSVFFVRLPPEVGSRPPSP